MILLILALCLLLLPLFWVFPRMVMASLLLSLLTLPLMFLVLPVFVLPPAALACGYLAFQRGVVRAPEPVGLAKRLLYALPMVLAVAVFVLPVFLFTTEYRA